MGELACLVGLWRLQGVWIGPCLPIWLFRQKAWGLGSISGATVQRKGIRSWPFGWSDSLGGGWGWWCTLYLARIFCQRGVLFLSLRRELLLTWMAWNRVLAWEWSVMLRQFWVDWSCRRSRRLGDRSRCSCGQGSCRGWLGMRGA